MSNTQKNRCLIINPNNSNYYIIKKPCHNKTSNLYKKIIEPDLEKKIEPIITNENIVLHVLEKTDTLSENNIKIINDINNCIIETNDVIQCAEKETAIEKTLVVEKSMEKTLLVEKSMEKILEEMLNISKDRIPDFKKTTSKMFNLEKIKKINTDQKQDKNIFNIELNEIIRDLKNNFNNDMAKIIDIYISNKKDIPSTLSEIFTTMIKNKIKTLSIL